MTDPTNRPNRTVKRLIAGLWLLALAAAAVNELAGAVKAAVREPFPMREKVVQEAGAQLRAAPPANGRALVLLPAAPSEDSLSFSYRLQYLAYPIRIDRSLWPWDEVNAAAYRDIYLCDDLMMLTDNDVEWHAGAVYRLRTPITTGKLHGSAQ